MTEVIAGVEIPQTAAAVEATRAIRESVSQLLFDHSRRVFLFGAMHAQLRGLEPDPELLYLAALYHDTGLATPYSDEEQRFEIDGADHARKFLVDQGFPARSADTVWTAIALHTTPAVPDRLGPEIAATARGVLTDVVGLGLEGLDPAQVDEVIAAHPRGDFKNEFLQSLRRRACLPPRHDVRHGERGRARALRAWTSGVSAWSSGSQARPGQPEGQALRPCTGGGAIMHAVTVRDRAAGVAGLTLTDLPYPHAAENDVIVRVHAAGFTPGELDWPSTWTDRAGRDRTPSVPGHELSGVVVELGYGTTGLTVGQRVFGVTDWARNGSLAEYAAVEARNLAPLPADIDHTVAAALPISGLTAWQGLFDHGRLRAGQTVLVHGAAGGVGSIAVQLAREAGAR